MTKHTPGPWKVEEDESGLYISMEPLAGTDEYLAIYASPNPDQRQADARLIAAAPALLAALEASTKIHFHNEYCPACEIARAAIAAAEEE